MWRFSAPQKKQLAVNKTSQSQESHVKLISQKWIMFIYEQKSYNSSTKIRILS